ncbi:MAG: universal stress protein, partial [Pseudomonadota bacterium]
MIQFLEHHGVAARHEPLKTTHGDGETLVGSAANLGADLLLCGAYSRGRLQEWIFGGVTTHLLAETDVPVLMMHH